jgi:hypothetical protein
MAPAPATNSHDLLSRYQSSNIDGKPKITKRHSDSVMKLATSPSTQRDRLGDKTPCPASTRNTPALLAPRLTAPQTATTATPTSMA